MATKDRVVNYDYFDAEGKSLGSKANEAAVGLHFNFVKATGALTEKGAKVYETARTETVTFADFPENILNAMAAHGFKQKGGDLFAGAVSKGEEPAEMFLAGIEHLMAGNWNAATKAGGAGPRPSMIKQALSTVLIRDHGAEDGDDLQARVAAAVATEEGQKSAMANAAVKAEYEALRLKAMQERAEKAAAAAEKAAESGEADDFLANLA